MSAPDATVFDASALLVYLQGEPGADVVEASLGPAAVSGAAKWSETAQKVMSAGGDWELAKALLESHGVQVAAVTAEDGEWAARRWRRGEGLSLGDRLCLALGERLDLDVLTADTAWGKSERIRQIR
jgi:PIN domain nuclease of toxin-antitoxin system